MQAEQWRLLAAAFEDRAREGSTTSFCSICMDVSGMAGAGITLMDGDQAGPLCVAGTGAADLEDLQFTLGEGPCHDAYRSGSPVRVSRLDVDAPIRWVTFAELAVRIGVASVFAYPLTCDDARLGVLTLYETRPGDVSDDQHDVFLGLADALAASIAAMTPASPQRSLGTALDSAFATRAELHQASGMVAVQLGIPAAQGLVRLRAHAFASSTPVSQIAADIVGRRLRLEDDHLPFIDDQNENHE